MNLMTGMLRCGKLDEFVVEAVNMHNDEYKDKCLWEIWLHKVFDKSFAEFMAIADGKPAQEVTAEEAAGIVAETKNMLTHFSPE